jgi:hypothetical protein
MMIAFFFFCSGKQGASAGGNTLTQLLGLSPKDGLKCLSLSETQMDDMF